ncbi:MAG TPA: DNA polymerase III subunit beta [Candidatus Saccharimonadales bacterium]|nr:DNA polymerase III subunit beta [Candidatus Saccharimonadales bacterium]
MKLKVTQENLNKALGLVARVANSRSTLPILSNVLLKIEENRLSVSATNLDIAISCQLGAQVQSEGSLTVPARLLQDFINGLPSGVIELEQEEQRLKITTDSYKSVINGVAADEFPVMPAIEGGTSWKVSGPLLKKALQQVLMAASNDESRPVLTGVLFQTVDGVLYAAATDSYRLAEKRLVEVKKDVKLLIPATALHDVLRIINDFEGDIQVVHDDQQVQFRAGEVELVARLIEGNYPDYRKLVPAKFATTATMPRAELTNITKVSSLFARESAGSIVVSVDEPSESIWIHAVASQLGENNATLKVDAKGSGSITLNSRYLIDALQAIDEKTVRLGFNGKLEAAMLTSPEADGYLHIIMPLKS